MAKRKQQPDIPPEQVDALDLLIQWLGRFGDTMRQEWGEMTESGMFRKNARTLPSAFNRRTKIYNHEQFSQNDGLDQVQYGKYYAVQVHQERYERWADDCGVFSLALTASLDDDEEVRQLIRDPAKPAISPRVAQTYLYMGHQTKRHQQAMAHLDRQPATAINRLKRALLEAEGERFYELRKIINCESAVELIPRYETEILIDIDGSKIEVAGKEVKFPKETTHAAAMKLARRIVADLFPDAEAIFISPSTNGGGVHIRVIVRWRDDVFANRNAFITHLQRYLKAQYVCPDGHAHVDVVRGLACYFKHNRDYLDNYYARPEYESWDGKTYTRDFGPSVGEEYEQKKKRRGTKITVRPELERIIRVHAGDQATMPMHPRMQSQDQREAFRAYLQAKPMPQSKLAMRIGWDLIRACPVNNNQNNLKQTRERRKANNAPQTPLGAYASGVDCVLPPAKSKAAQALENDVIFGDGNDYIRRRSWLAGYAVRQTNGDRDRAIELTLQLWELETGPTSDRERHIARVRKAEYAVDAYINGVEGKIEPFDAKKARPGAKAGEPGQDSPLYHAWHLIQDKYNNSLRKWLSRLASIDWLHEICDEHGNGKHGAVLDHHLLAWAASIFCYLIVTEGQTYTCRHTGQPRIKGRHEAPAKLVKLWLIAKGCPEARAAATTAAARRVLEELNLISMTRNYLAGVPGKAPGECRQFKLGRRFKPQAWAANLLKAEDWLEVKRDQIKPEPVKVKAAAPSERAADHGQGEASRAWPNRAWAGRGLAGAQSEQKQEQNETNEVSVFDMDMVEVDVVSVDLWSGEVIFRGNGQIRRRMTEISAPEVRAERVGNGND